VASCGWRTPATTITAVVVSGYNSSAKVDLVASRSVTIEKIRDVDVDRREEIDI
jgi:hypothetical protein